MTSGAVDGSDGEIALGERLSRHLTDAKLLHDALVHRSYCAEHPGEASNERLEFLGDAVLEIVVTEYLFSHHPQMAEGDLARIRAACVSEEALAPLAIRLGVGSALYLGRGEDTSGGREKPSLLADAFESLIGATYLDGGLERARALVLELMSERLDSEAARPDLGDAKNRLQEQAARLGIAPPRYESSVHGPEHARRFVSTVEVGSLRASGEGRSRKSAERAAAERAIVALADIGRGA